MIINVTLLERIPPPTEWSDEEINLLRLAGLDVQINLQKLHRLVIRNQPLHGKTFAGILGHSNFTSREVTYANRWN